MKFEAQSLVAIVAIAANFCIAWISLRSQRRGAHIDRIWNRKAETYEELVGYCVRLMKERHEWATGSQPVPFQSGSR